MNELLREIVETEQQAAALVARAEADAATLLANARQFAQQRATEDEAATRQTAAELLAGSCREAEARKRGQLAAAAAEIPRTIALQESIRTAFLDAALRFLRGTGG